MDFSTSNLGLFFQNEPLFDDPKATWPNAQVYIKSNTAVTNEAGAKLVLISCQCMDLKAFEAEIERLHEELDAVANDARLKFAAAERAGSN